MFSLLQVLLPLLYNNNNNRASLGTFGLRNDLSLRYNDYFSFCGWDNNNDGDNKCIIYFSYTHMLQDNGLIKKTEVKQIKVKE